ncbi:hypothetical protein M427DRAFT_135504 [Gonapodya prolifera JEL478]|uniref:SH3 domain-containing protein n=1 Tax=Gonapodya prolifera (strain JEL478) TaxID=1344416 RepID=A0A139ADD7_GONPJ|nr:hypothetical protein M427DRAFT_135504 [Gonapodya prolifera JEL478]|eukprot:KXS14811.1 hypothetical protein M427DRAFT_135504 [Gonapodya prolifera JEL478]
MADANHTNAHDLASRDVAIPSKRVAMFAYTPGPGAHVDEIAVEEGDLLVLERRFADGWGVARNARTGEKGVFPWEYCFGEGQEQEDAESNNESTAGAEHPTARDVQAEADFHEGATFRLSGTNIALNLPGSFIDEEAQDLAVKLQTATHIRKSSGIIDRRLLDPDPDAREETFSVVKEQVPPVRKPTPSALSINLANMVGDGDGPGKSLTTTPSNSAMRSFSRQSVSSSATSGSLSHSKPSTVSLSHVLPMFHSDTTPFPSSYVCARSGSVSTQGELSQDSDFLSVSTADGGFSYRFNLDWKSSKTASMEEIMGTVGGPGWVIQRSWGYKLSRHDPRSMYFKYEARNRSLRELEHEVPMFSFTIFLFSTSLFTSMEHLSYKVPSLHPDIFRTHILVPLSTVLHRFKWSELIETEWAVIEPPPEFWTPGMDLHVAYVVRDPADNERGDTTMRRMKAEVSKWIDQNMRMGDWAQCQARMSVFNGKSS